MKLEDYIKENPIIEYNPKEDEFVIIGKELWEGEWALIEIKNENEQIIHYIKVKAGTPTTDWMNELETKYKNIR